MLVLRKDATWGLYCDKFEENWLRYNDTALYPECFGGRMYSLAVHSLDLTVNFNANNHNANNDNNVDNNNADDVDNNDNNMITLISNNKINNKIIIMMKMIMVMNI